MKKLIQHNGKIWPFSESFSVYYNSPSEMIIQLLSVAFSQRKKVVILYYAMSVRIKNCWVCPIPPDVGWQAIGLMAPVELRALAAPPVFAVYARVQKPPAARRWVGISVCPSLPLSVEREWEKNNLVKAAAKCQKISCSRDDAELYSGGEPKI